MCSFGTFFSPESGVCDTVSKGLCDQGNVSIQIPNIYPYRSFDIKLYVYHLFGVLIFIQRWSHEISFLHLTWKTFYPLK